PPAGDLLTRARRVGVESAHDAEAVGMRRGRCEGNVVAVALPGRRHDDDTVDAGLVHPGQKLILAERRRAVRLGARRPGPLWRVGGPDMDLGVDDLPIPSLPPPPNASRLPLAPT